jgi:N-acetylneuraminate synthase
MAAGETITADCIRSVRPGYGLPPKYFDSIVGKSVNQDITKYTPVIRDILSI